MKIPTRLCADPQFLHRKKPQCSDTAAHRPSFKQQSKVASRTASSSSSFESRAARELRIALKNMRVDDEARREHAANLEDEIVDRFDASASASGHYSARQDIFNDGDNDNHGATFAETEFDFESEL